MSLPPRRLRTTAALLVVCLAGSGTAVALAEDDDDGPQATTPSGAGAPRIDEIEVEAVSGGRLLLETELSGRATSVRFVYRGRTIKGRRQADGDWARIVKARGGDRRDRLVRVRVRACNGTRCVSRTGSDDA